MIGIDKGLFFLFFLFYFTFLFLLVCPGSTELSTASVLGWTVFVGFTTVLLLNDSCKSTFPSGIPSPVFVSVYGVGVDPTLELYTDHYCQLSYFPMMFLTGLSWFFSIWNHTTNVRGLSLWQKKDWRCRIHSVTCVEVARI